MDTTMQSPIRATIPLPPPPVWVPPFPNNAEVTLPSGPHHYVGKTWIGKISQGITPQQAFESLSRHATPFQERPSVDGRTVNIPAIGPVSQHVDPDHLTIVNTTEPGHIAHPGNVFRSIVREGDDLYVKTEGYGTGAFPRQNELAGPYVWELTDRGIRSELNPPPPPQYSIDGTETATLPSGPDPVDRRVPGGPVASDDLPISQRAPLFFGSL